MVCLVCCQVMGVVGPSSVADGLPLLHLSPYLSPPLPFSTAVVRLVALQIQVWRDDPIKHPLIKQLLRVLMLIPSRFSTGLEGRLPPQSRDLTFHQSGKAGGDAAQPAHSLRVNCRLREQR